MAFSLITADAIKAGFNNGRRSPQAREKRLAPTAVQLVELVLMKPVPSSRTVQEYLKVTPQGARKALTALLEAGILTEITGRKRDKAYAANEVLKALEGEKAPG